MHQSLCLSTLTDFIFLHSKSLLVTICVQQPVQWSTAKGFILCADNNFVLSMAFQSTIIPKFASILDQNGFSDMNSSDICFYFNNVPSFDAVSCMIFSTWDLWCHLFQCQRFLSMVSLHSLQITFTGIKISDEALLTRKTLKRPFFS